MNKLVASHALAAPDVCCSDYRGVAIWDVANIKIELYAVADFAIPVSWYNFVDYYPLFTKTNVTTKTGTKIKVTLKDPRGSLNGELDGWATENINEDPKYTTCCIQMPHAINMAFVNSDVSNMVGTHSVRRNTHAATIARAGREFHYLAAVDEMKAFLDDPFEPGRKISSRKDIDDQPEIVVFMRHVSMGRPYRNMARGQLPPNIHEEQLRFLENAERMVLEPRRSDSGRHLVERPWTKSRRSRLYQRSRQPLYRSIAPARLDRVEPTDHLARPVFAPKGDRHARL